VIFFLVQRESGELRGREAGVRRTPRHLKKNETNRPVKGNSRVSIEKQTYSQKEGENMRDGLAGERNPCDLEIVTNV